METKTHTPEKFSNLPSFNLISQNNRKTYRGSEHPSKRWGHSVVLNNRAMIIFGGHHGQRSLSNIYSLDFTTLTWSKIEPCGNCPPARDSHSAVIINNNDMLIFGGNSSSGKLNDLWNFNFIDKKWTYINSKGDIPSPRDGHLSAVIKNFMVVYSGLDDKETENVIEDVKLYDINEKFWYDCEIIGELKKRDGLSCCLVNENMYLFGGQGPSDDEYSNDLSILQIEINDDYKDLKKKPKAIIKMCEINNNSPKPQVRASQTCVNYKNQFLIIIGGEGKTKIPLNDIWVFDLKTKIYTEVQLEGKEKIEGRFCHSCLIYGDILALYGGMQNSEVTLDNLTVLSIESKNGNNNKNNNNNSVKKDVEILPNNKKRKLNDNKNKNNNNINNNVEDDNNIHDNNICNNNVSNYQNELVDFSADTNDLLNMNFYSFEEIKKNYLNNLITWDFLKSLSDFYKWPIGCIGNLIQNSLKDHVCSKNVYIDIKKIKNTDEIYLSIKDDGKGILCTDFNGIMFSFIKNQNKELNYFQYGFSMKASALRLADSFLIISKTAKEFSIGMISKKLQKKITDSDFILTPIVNYRIEKNPDNNKMNYIPKSNYPLESLNLILDIISFLFKDKDELSDYIDSFNTGTHIFLFDLKTNDKSDNGYLRTVKDTNILNNNIGNISTNYELLFEEETKDIYLNEDIGFNEDSKQKIIDFSLKRYLSFMYLKPHKQINIYLFQKKVEIENPYYNIKLLSSSGKNIKKISQMDFNKENSNSDNEQNEEIIDCFYLDSKTYNGLLFNEKFIDSITSNNNMGVDDIKEKDYLNGVLLYKNNILISRLNQAFFGDLSFFIKKLMNIKENENSTEKNDYKSDNINFAKQLFKKHGYIQLPSIGYELMFNNMEIKDQVLFGYIYNKIKNLLHQINK